MKPNVMSDNRIRVLLIEDDVIDQLAFKRMVADEALPYSCTIAGSASEARSILFEGSFDIIVSDFSLGDGTAFDAIDFRQHAPVIMITGVGSEDIAVTAMKKGAYDYLAKDLDRTYLQKLPIAVENAIKRKTLEEDKKRLLIDLQKALSHVKRLSGLLPICASCQKIRDDKGYWTKVADYISEHSEATFTHGMCPECAEKLYGEFLDESDRQPLDQMPE